MEPLLLQFLLRTLDAGYSDETIKHTFELLITRGFRLIAEEEEEEYKNVTPEISSILQHEIDEYLARQKDQLYIQAYYLEGEEELKLIILLLPEEGLLNCWLSNADLDTDPNKGVIYQILTDIFKDLYRIWHPFYGFEEYSGGSFVSRNKLLTEQQAVYLYFINFFGPELVNKLGRERVLSAPAWKIEEMDDGGIFLMPVDPTASVATGYTLKGAAAHLGLNTPQAPDEEWDWEDREDEE